MAAEVVFLNRMGGVPNVGDLLCSPYLYFKHLFPNSRRMEIHLGDGRRGRWRNAVINSRVLLRSKALVIGGGGLLGLQYFADDLGYWSSTPFCPKVLWGAGHNAHDVFAVDRRDTSTYRYTQMNRFDKIGIRDWDMGYDWVPCASCMHPELSLPVSESCGLVAALHYETRDSGTFLRDLIRSTNLPVEIVYNNDCAEAFIGKMRSARAVVTNSYHGVYWATLLGKRVVVVGGGSKVRMLKHSPVIASLDDWPRKIEEASVYSDALEECRERSCEFCQEAARICA
jgi:hypothetical protein